MNLPADQTVVHVQRSRIEKLASVNCMHRKQKFQILLIAYKQPCVRNRRSNAAGTGTPVYQLKAIS